jgi:Mg-chelatase subunit ChlD
MRRWLLVVLLAAAPARADEPTPEAPPLPRVVAGRLDGTVLRLGARFAVHGDGPGLWSPTSLPLPEPSIVTGAVAISGASSHRLSLVDSDVARETFDAIQDADPAADREWAVRLSAESGTAEATVDVAAPRAARLEVEVELELPTCFYRDVRYATIPGDWRTVLDPALASRARKHVEGLVESCGGQETSTWLAFPSHEIESAPGELHAGVLGGRLPLGKDHLARIELDLARQLSDVPADLHTAIVIDGSRSLSAREAAEQRAIVSAYLRAAPHGSVQVIAYARDARALLPAWTDATAALPKIQQALRELVARNGSNLDRGLQEASAWLARSDGTKRVVVFSDQRVAERLENAAPSLLQAMLPQGTLVHVVALTGGSGSLERADDVMFGGLAEATQGIGLRGATDTHGDVDATILARPISLDRLRFSAPGWTELERKACVLAPDEEGEGSLGEGHACTWWGRGGVEAGPVTITGLAWNKRFVQMVRPDPVQRRQLARELTMTNALDGDVIRPAIERAAAALDSAWSLLATWGGTGGYNDVGMIGSIGGTSTGSCCSDFGTSSSDRGYSTVNLEPLDLRAQFADAVAHCKPDGARIEIAIELTQEEIVEVAVGVTGAGAREQALHDCVVDAVWDTPVAVKNAPEHATTKFAF